MGGMMSPSIDRLHTWLQTTLEAPCTLQPLIGGSSNTLYHVECAGRPYVLRVNAPSSLAFSVNRYAEAKVLELIQPYSWAVQIVRNDVRIGLCLMQHYQAVTNPLAQPQFKQLLQAVHELQSIAIPETALNTLTIDYSYLTAQYQAKLDQYPNAKAAAWLKEWQQGLQALPTLPAVLVHQDLHQGNLCYRPTTPKQLILIDWEYAGLGNAWFDAVPLALWGLSHSSLRALPAFQHLSAKQWREGLQLATRLTQVLTDLWYWARVRL